MSKQIIFVIQLLLILITCCQNVKSDRRIVARDSTIVFINIKDLSREALGRLINSVDKHNPRIIAIDAIFSDLSDGLSDSILAQSILHSHKVVLPINIAGIDNTFHRSHSKFAKNALAEGAMSYLKNDLGEIEYYIPIFQNNAEQLFSFPTVIALNLTNPSDKILHFKVNEPVKVELTKQQDDFDLLDDSDFDEGDIKDKIVIFGDFAGKPDATTGNGKSKERSHSLVATANIILALIELK